MPLLQAQLEIVRRFPKAAQELIRNSGVDEVIDALAEVKLAESGGAAARRLGQAEIEHGDKGSRFRVVIPRQAERSYNTGRLVTKVAEAKGISPLRAITYLINADILRVNWQFTKLKQLMNELDLPLTTVPHEITDGDNADIGEVWGDGYPKYELINQEEG